MAIHSEILPVHTQLLELAGEEALFFTIRRPQAVVAGHLVRVAAYIEPVRQASQRLLQRQRRVDLGIHVAARQPLVAQLGSHMQIHRGNDPHVALAPLAAAIRNLILEEFKRVETQLGLWNLERLAEYVGRLVLDQQQVPVGLALAELLHNAQIVDQREEVSPRKIRNRLRREWVDRVSQLVHLGPRRSLVTQGVGSPLVQIEVRWAQRRRPLLFNWRWGRFVLGLRLLFAAFIRLPFLSLMFIRGCIRRDWLRWLRLRVRPKVAEMEEAVWSDPSSVTWGFRIWTYLFSRRSVLLSTTCWISW